MTLAKPTVHQAGSPIEILQKHGRSFHWAEKLLSGAQLQNVASLYSLCRAIDDLADEAVGPAQINSARATLTELAEALEADTLPAGDSLSLYRQARDLFGSDETPNAALVDMIQTIIGDLEPVAVQTHRELRQYAYGVAGTVGVMMTCLLEVEQRNAALAHAIDLGIGMQLTSIARDVLEDAYLGRVYLPADGAAGALRASDITSGDAEARCRAWKGVQELLLMAEGFYGTGWRGLRFLPMRARLSIAVAARVYREIGVKILGEGEAAYWRHRCIVGLSRKVVVSAKALVDLLGGSGLGGQLDDPSALHRDLNVCFSLPERS